MNNAVRTIKVANGNTVAIGSGLDARVAGIHEDYVVTTNRATAEEIQSELKAWGVTSLVVLSRADARQLGIC